MQEPTDLDTRAVTRFAGYLVVAAVVIHLLMWGLFAFLRAHEAAGDRPPLAVAGELPPEPRLRTAPRDDMRGIRETEERRLGSYGWVDRPAGVVHIPIERAIDLTAERGLPVRIEVR
jgi:hypothetical protein